MPDTYEKVVRWYLRFNGYLAVENFVIHEPVVGGVAQGGETDLLAVRFPHSNEQARVGEKAYPFVTHGALRDEEATRDSLIDFVIAEVKVGSRAALNKVWRPPQDQMKLDRIQYLLRWLGPLQENALPDVAKELHSLHRSRKGNCLFRLVFFGLRERAELHKTGTRQITFRQIAEFFVRDRVACWDNFGLGSRSSHPQWDPLINDAWRVAGAAAGGSEDERIATVVGLFEKAAKAS
jgi:hypothetical protein